MTNVPVATSHIAVGTPCCQLQRISGIAQLEVWILEREGECVDAYAYASKDIINARAASSAHTQLSVNYR